MARLDNGFPTTVTFATQSGVGLYVIEVTPPGVSGGGAIDVTNMLNTAWRTASPKSLKTLTEFGLLCAYDEAVLTSIIAMVNVNQLITVHFPDTHTWAFWGYLDDFKPNTLKEGDRPTADLKFLCTNHDGSNNEVAPVRT